MLVLMMSLRPWPASKVDERELMNVSNLRTSFLCNEVVPRYQMTPRILISRNYSQDKVTLNTCHSRGNSGILGDFEPLSHDVGKNAWMEMAS